MANNFSEASETIFVNYLGYGCFDEPYTERMSTSQIEYVRKDAFIEEVCEWIRNNYHNYADNALGKEYLTNDFKKHMEG